MTNFDLPLPGKGERDVTKNPSRNNVRVDLRHICHFQPNRSPKPKTRFFQWQRGQALPKFEILAWVLELPESDIAEPLWRVGDDFDAINVIWINAKKVIMRDFWTEITWKVGLDT